MVERTKQTDRSENVKAKVLACLATAGVVALAVLAPNAVQLLRYTKNNSRRRARYLAYVNSMFGRLENQGLIKLASRDGKKFARLTAKGQQTLDRYRLRTLQFRHRSRWNGQWHLVIFDIKEWKRRERDQLRRELVTFGFQRLQNSVWITPWDCQEFVTLLKTSFGLGRQVLYIVAKQVEDEISWKERFGLP